MSQRGITLLSVLFALAASLMLSAALALRRIGGQGASGSPSA